MLSFSIYDFAIFVKNQVSIGAWIYVSVFDSVPLINLSIPTPMLWSFYDDCSAVQLEVRAGDNSGSSFIVQDCFCYPGFLFFHPKLRTALSRSEQLDLQNVGASVFSLLVRIIWQIFVKQDYEGLLTLSWQSYQLTILHSVSFSETLFLSVDELRNSCLVVVSPNWSNYTDAQFLLWTKKGVLGADMSLVKWSLIKKWP